MEGQAQIAAPLYSRSSVHSLTLAYTRASPKCKALCTPLVKAGVQPPFASLIIGKKAHITLALCFAERGARFAHPAEG